MKFETDRYGEETSWYLIHDPFGTNETLASESSFGPAANYAFPICLARGETYSFEMKDTVGDGICCKYGRGWYSFSLNGEEKKRGGEFAELDLTTFTV